MRASRDTLALLLSFCMWLCLSLARFVLRVALTCAFVCVCVCVCVYTVYAESIGELKASMRLALITKQMAETCAAAAAYKTQTATGV